MKEKKRLRRRCSFCGKVGTVGEEVFCMTDPFWEEVYEEIVKVWLHEDCRDELADEV